MALIHKLAWSLGKRESVCTPRLRLAFWFDCDDPADCFLAPITCRDHEPVSYLLAHRRGQEARHPELALRQEEGLVLLWYPPPSMQLPPTREFHRDDVASDLPGGHQEGVDAADDACEVRHDVKRVGTEHLVDDEAQLTLVLFACSTAKSWAVGTVSTNIC